MESSCSISAIEQIKYEYSLNSYQFFSGIQTHLEVLSCTQQSFEKGVFLDLLARRTWYRAEGCPKQVFPSLNKIVYLLFALVYIESMTLTSGEIAIHFTFYFGLAILL